MVAIAAIGALCVRLGSCVEQSTSTSSAIAYHRFGVVPGPLFRNGTASPRNSRILPSICQRFSDSQSHARGEGGCGQLANRLISGS